MITTTDGRLLTNDEIIDIRDTLLSRAAKGALSVIDQNLLRDCDIALGVVRCKPETREEARARVSLAVTLSMGQSQMLTADTITDEQIGVLYNEGAIDAYRLMSARSNAPNWRREHRSRCAEIFNARNGR